MENVVYYKNVEVNALKEMHIYISKDYEIADGVVLGYGVCLLGKGLICEGCEIGSNSIIENCDIGANTKIKSSYLENSIIGGGCTIGPFAHIRDNSELRANCRVGNFVEIKRSRVGAYSKMAHLAYIGDAEIGNNCNIGCGVIFCNYDGKVKRKSVLGNNVFVGSNTNLIAPLNIGDNVYIAGGSTITQDIEKDGFAIARARQINKKGFNNPYVNK